MSEASESFQDKPRRDPSYLSRRLEGDVDDIHVLASQLDNDGKEAPSALKLKELERQVRDRLHRMGYNDPDIVEASLAQIIPSGFRTERAVGKPRRNVIKNDKSPKKVDEPDPALIARLAQEFGAAFQAEIL